MSVGASERSAAEPDPTPPASPDAVAACDAATARAPRPPRTLAPLGRICKKSDFNRAFATGKSARDGLMKVVVARTALPQVRLGLTTSRKLGGAVERNRWRRRLREAFRQVGLDLPKGLDVVCVPFRQEREPAFDRVVDALRTLSRAALARLERVPRPPSESTSPSATLEATDPPSAHGAD